jgi:hypothetical protein
MRATRLFALGCAVSLICLAAPTIEAQPQARQAPPSRDAAVPFKVGETLTFDVTWSNYLVAGTATLRVVDRRASLGAPAYTVVAEGRPVQLLAKLYTLYYKLESLVEAASLLPQRTTYYAEEGAARTTTITRFDRAARKASFEVQQDKTTKTMVDIGPRTQDGLSAIYTLRTMAFRAGDVYTFAVLDDGQLYTARLAVGPTEMVAVPHGQTRAWNVKVAITDADGQPAGSNAAVWISTDGRRLPIKLQADLAVGNFVLALREAQ